MQNLFSKSVILFSGLVFLSLLVLNLSNVAFYTGNLASILYHFGIPFGLAGMVFYALRLSPPFRLSVALSLVSVVFGLYAAELYLTVQNEAHRGKATAATGPSYDRRSKIEVIQDLRRSGDDAYPVMRAKSMLTDGPGDTLVPALTAKEKGFLPLASVPSKTVVSCNESGQWLTYKSDRHGFHNPPGTWQAPSPKIAIVGDSFAHGSCVPSGSNAAAWLRKRFGSVLNLGVSGYGPITELASLREYLEQPKPEIVLWFYFEGNDLTEDLAFETRSDFLMRYYRDSGFRQGLIDRADEVSNRLKTYLDKRLIEAMGRVDDPDELMLDFLTLYHLREVMGLGANSIGILQGGGSERTLKMFAGILKEARRSVKAWGGEFYFVFLPESARYFAAARDNDIRNYLRTKVLSEVAALDIPTIDVHQAFVASPDARKLFQYPGSHYNADGYRVAAKAIEKALSAPPKSP